MESVWAGVRERMEGKVMERLRSGYEKSREFLMNNALDPGALKRKVQEHAQEAEAKIEAIKADGVKGAGVAVREFVLEQAGEDVAEAIEFVEEAKEVAEQFNSKRRTDE